MKKIVFLFFILTLPFANTANASCIRTDSIPLTLEISALYPNPAEDESEWIEITNTGSDPIDLSFYTLEDATANPFQLSGTLTANESLQLSDLPFQLNNGGDEAILKTIDGEWIDTLSYSSSQSGEIISKNSSSAPTEEPVVEEIVQEETSTPSLWPDYSEALPNPEGTDSTEEWIELYNPYTETITLDGLSIDDEEGGSSPHALSGTMDPESYFLISIEDSDITLNNSIDSVRLLGASGEVLWEVSYENPTEGESYAFFTNSYKWTNQPSPNAENIASSSEEEAASTFENGDLSEDVEITEVYPNPEGPDAEEEWIEITNGGTETVNLGNWIIDDATGGSDPYVFPDDTIIEPGETLVLYRPITNIALNNSNETVQLVDFTGEVMDEISFDSSEEGKSFSKIEIEEISSTQASALGLGTRTFSTWQWLMPSPGAINPKWTQFVGEVLDFEENMLSLQAGPSTWTLKAVSGDMEDFIFQIGNTVLIQAALKNDIYEIMYSELLETATKEEKNDFPWSILASGILASVWIGYELYKKRAKKHMTPGLLA